MVVINLLQLVTNAGCLADNGSSAPLIHRDTERHETLPDTSGSVSEAFIVALISCSYMRCQN
jgi:hypothetical protein